MSTLLDDNLQKIWEYLDSGNLELADQQLTDLEGGKDTEIKDQLDILRTMYYLEIRYPKKSKNLLQPFVFNIWNYPTPMQVEILTLDCRVKISQSEFMKAESSINKIQEIWETLTEAEKREVSHCSPEIKNFEGVVLASKGNYQAAISEFESAAMEFRTQGRLRQRATSLYNTARVLSMLGQTEKAIAILEDAASVFKESELYESLSMTYELLITLHETLGDRDGVYTYKQLKQNLKERLEFQKFKQTSIQERDHLNEELTQAKMMIKNLKEELFSLKFEMDSRAINSTNENTLIGEIDKQKADKFDILTQENGNLTQKVKGLEHEVNELKEEIKAYKHELGQIVETKQALAQEMVKNEMLQADIEELEDKLQEASTTTSTSPINSLNSEIEELRKLLNESEREIAKLNEEKSTLVQQSMDHNQDHLKTKVIELQNRITESKLEQEKLKETIGELEKDKTTLDKQLKDLSQSALNKFEEKIEKANRVKESLEDEIDELKRKITTMVNEDSKRVLELREENSTLKEKLTELEEKSSTKLENSENHMSRILQEDVKILEDRILKASEEQENLKIQYSIADKKLKEKQNEIATIIREKELIETENDDLKEKILNLERENLDMKLTLERMPQTTNVIDKKDQVTSSAKITADSPKGKDQEVSNKSEVLPENFVTGDLEHLLASSKLVEMVYTRLKALKSVNLRILAMQAGLSVERCSDAIVQLKNVGAIKYDERLGTVRLV